MLWRGLWPSRTIACMLWRKLCLGRNRLSKYYGSIHPLVQNHSHLVLEGYSLA